MCISDEKFKKKFEGKNLSINKLLNLKEKSNELKLDLYSDSFVKINFEINKEKEINNSSNILNTCNTHTDNKIKGLLNIFDKTKEINNNNTNNSVNNALNNNNVNNIRAYKNTFKASNTLKDTTNNNGKEYFRDFEVVNNPNNKERNKEMVKNLTNKMNKPSNTLTNKSNKTNRDFSNKKDLKNEDSIRSKFSNKKIKQ